MQFLFDRLRSRVRDETLAWLARLTRGLGPGEGPALLAWLKRRSHRIAIAKAAVGWNEPEVLALLSEIFPISRAILEPRRGRPPALVAIASVCIAVGVPIGILLVAESHRHIYTTAAGATGRLTLADGTRVELNRGTQIDVTYAGTARSVLVMRGEALFKVVGEPYRSFYLHAAGRNFETRAATFDVRFIASNTLCLTVLEGTVTVFPRPVVLPPDEANVRVFGSKADQPILLKPLQMLMIEDHTESGKMLTQQDVVSRLSWQRGL